MAIKEILTIKDEVLNEKYHIFGKRGVFIESGYKMENDDSVIDEKNNTKRFILIDLWQLGVFGSENCNQLYDEEKDINIIREEDFYICLRMCTGNYKKS